MNNMVLKPSVQTCSLVPGIAFNLFPSRNGAEHNFDVIRRVFFQFTHIGTFYYGLLGRPETLAVNH